MELEKQKKEGPFKTLRLFLSFIFLYVTLGESRSPAFYPSELRGVRYSKYGFPTIKKTDVQ